MKNKGKAFHHFPPSYCDVACGQLGYESRENVTKVLGKDGTKHAGGRGQHIGVAVPGSRERHFSPQELCHPQQEGSLLARPFTLSLSIPL